MQDCTQTLFNRKLIQSNIINQEVTLIQKANTAVICLSPYQGGMELDSLTLSEMLSKVSDLTLIAQKDCFISSEYKKRVNPTFTLHEIAFKKSLSPSIIFGVRQIIQDKEIKNVLFLGASELKSLYFSFLGLEINLIIRHGTTKSSPKKDWFHRLIYSNVNYHISICKHLARNVKTIIPFGPMTQERVIYPSLNITPSQEVDYSSKPHQPLQLLHVGRIAAGKGQKTAIEACKILYENQIDFEFNLVGGFHDPYKETFLNFIETLEYREKINLVGHTKEVERYYLQSDIFLFPSDGEGLSNAFIEAMIYGLSTITYNNTSFPELQELGFSFALVENQDREALQTQLLERSQHYSKEKTYSKKNALLSQKLFSYERELEEFQELLR